MILYQADGETVTAYVMTEFLEPVDVDTLENGIVDEEAGAGHGSFPLQSSARHICRIE